MLLIIIFQLLFIQLINATHVCHSNVNWQPNINNNNNVNDILWSDSRFNWDIARYPNMYDNVYIDSKPLVKVNENGLDNDVYAIYMKDSGELLVNGSLVFNTSQCSIVNIPDPVTNPSFINTKATTSELYLKYDIPHDNGLNINYYTWIFNKQCAINVTSSSKSIPILNCLVINEFYNLTVTATNALGTSLPSNIYLYQHQLPPNKPNINMSLETTNNYENKLIVNWTSPLLNGGVFLRYEVNIWNTDDANYTLNTTNHGVIVHITPGSWYYAKVTVYTSFPVSNTSATIKLYTGPIITKVAYVSSTNCMSAYYQGLSQASSNIILNSTNENENILVLYGKHFQTYPNTYVRLYNENYQFNCTIICNNSTFIVAQAVGLGSALSIGVLSNGYESITLDNNTNIIVTYPLPVLTPKTLKVVSRPLSVISGRAIVSSSGLGEIIEITGEHFGTILKYVVVKYGLRDGLDDTKFANDPTPETCILQDDLLDNRIRCYLPDLNAAPGFRNKQGAMIQVSVAGQLTALPSTDRINFPAAPQVFSIEGCCACEDIDPNVNATKICNCPTGGGVTITIFGSALGTPQSLPTITVGGEDCTNVATTSTVATCTLPTGAGRGSIGVSSNGLSTVSSISVEYSPPLITSVKSENCTVDGCPRIGNNVIITLNGENFGKSDASVLIGSSRCENVIHLSDKQLTCVLPAGKDRNIPILMIQSNGFVSTNTYTNTSTCTSSAVNLPTISYEKCAPGFEANDTECAQCPSGKYGTNELCVICEGGKYANISGLSECFTCESGRYSIVEGSSFGPKTCSECQPGFFQKSWGRTFCSICAVGYFSNTNSSLECSRCPSGVPNKDEGSTSCINCTAPLFKVGESATSCSSCSIGTYYSKNVESCLVCPDNFICSNGEAFVFDGHWPYTSNDGNVASEECPISQFCVQGSCAEGRKVPINENPFCGQCEDGLYDWGNKCVKCEQTINGGFIFIAVFISMSITVFVFIMSQVESGHWRIFLFYCQTAILSLQTVESNWVAPLKLLDAGWISFSGESCLARISSEQRIFFEMLVSIATFVELFLLMITVIMTTICCPYISFDEDGSARNRGESKAIGKLPWEIENSLTSKKRVSMSSTSTISNNEGIQRNSISKVSNFEAIGRKKPTWKELLRPKKFRFAPFFRAAVALFIFNYNSIVKRSFDVLDCAKVQEYSVMRSTPSVDCNSNFYNTKLFPTAVILLTTVAGIIPLIFLVNLYMAHRKGILKRVKFLKFWGVLTEPYKHSAWYFSLVHITRRTILVAVAVFVPKDSKLPALAMTSFVVMVHHSYFKPFGANKSNKWETISLCALVFLPMLISSFHTPLKLGENIVVALYTLSIAVAILVRTVMVKVKVYKARKRLASPSTDIKRGSITSSTIRAVNPKQQQIELDDFRRRSLVNNAVARSLHNVAETDDINMDDEGDDDSNNSISSSNDEMKKQSDDLSLPNGWKKYLTEEDIPYYVHAASNTTQWHRPTSSTDNIDSS